jgi:hypothetical protein
MSSDQSVTNDPIPPGGLTLADLFRELVEELRGGR